MLALTGRMVRPQCVLCALLALDCRGDSPVPEQRVGRLVPAPAPADVGARCADVGPERACWLKHDAQAAPGVARVERPLPEAAALRGWRCRGGGAARVCEDPARSSDAFACARDRCTQRYPRLPDDGEWECSDHDGAVVCRSAGAAAGVVAAPPDPSWLCGPRKEARGERICVDFAPELPPGGPWACRFAHEHGRPERICTRRDAPALGFACSRGCPFGSACVGQRCLPLEPEPACWLDADCGAGRTCAHGSCRELPR
jgi:hypothetical protein